MITPQAGLAFMKQMQDMQKPGGTGIGAPPAGSPTQGLIARMMSDNPGGLIGALLKGGNAPVNPGMPAPAGSPGYVLGGQGPVTGGPPPQMGMLAGLMQKLGMGGASAPGGMPPMMPPDIAGGYQG